jgi:TolA-binding protein
MMSSKEPYRDRLKLADRIAHEGFIIDPPCIRCARMNERRTVECRRVPSNKKCGNCVQSGRKCEQDFHPEEKWARLDKVREKVNAELATMENELSSLEEESWKRQEELFKMQEKVSKGQMDILKIIRKHSRLRRQKKYLDERNMKMLNHDLEILEDLDEQNPPPSPPSEEMDFPSSEDLSPSQLLDQMSPDFWAQLGITTVADDNSEVVAGNLSSCQ